MFYNLLFEVIRTLTLEEIKLFKVFLKSPYFNTSNRIILLFDEITKYYPHYDHHILTKQKLHYSYSDKPFNESTLRNLTWKLSNLLDEFLLQVRIKNEKLDSLNYLLKEYNSRYIKDSFEFVTKKIEKGTFGESLFDNDDFYGKYMYSLNRTNFHIMHDKVFMKKNVVDEQIKSLSDTGLLMFYAFITELIKEYVNIMSSYFNYDIDYKSNYIFEILREMKIKNILECVKGKTKYDYVLELYIKLFDTYNNIENEKYYYEYKNSFLKYIDLLNGEARSFHFSVLLDLCVRIVNLNKSRTKFIEEEFKIYEIMLKNEYYKEDGKINYLSTIYFRNILFAAVKLKKFDWLQNFIEKYSQKVPADDRQNMLNYGFAYLYFEKREYNLSAKYLLKISIDTFEYKYDIRNLTLKIYYELEDYEGAFDTIDSYKHFLNKSKLLSKNHKEIFFNFLNYTEKLLNYKLKNKHIEINRVKNSLIKDEKVVYKNWLTEKVNELLPAKQKKVIAS
jgi:hypothetical protein